MALILSGTKLLWHMERVRKHFDGGRRVAPIHIDWGLSKFCDISCVFCFGVFQNLKREFIQREPLLQSIREAGEIGVKSIGFIGDGEPLMNPYVYDALKMGKAMGIDMAISTNGVTLDTEEKALTVLNSCAWMRFCLSAGDREGYKKIHRVDRFDIVVENIRRIVGLKEKIGSKCDIGLQAVFVPEFMQDDMVVEAKLAVGLGVDFFVIKQCSLPVGNKSVGKISFDINTYDDAGTIKRLEEAESYSTERTKIIPKYLTMARKGRRPYDGCKAVPFISEISGNGNWFPCGYWFSNKPEYAKYKFGNIHEKSLKEIFESDRYWDVIKTMYDLDVHKECHGSCRLDAANEFVSNYLDRPNGINFI